MKLLAKLKKQSDEWFLLKMTSSVFFGVEDGPHRVFIKCSVCLPMTMLTRNTPFSISAPTEQSTKLLTWAFLLRIIFNKVLQWRVSLSCCNKARSKEEAMIVYRLELFSSAALWHHWLWRGGLSLSPSWALLSIALSAVPQHSISACYLGTWRF